MSERDSDQRATNSRKRTRSTSRAEARDARVARNSGEAGEGASAGRDAMEALLSGIMDYISTVALTEIVGSGSVDESVRAQILQRVRRAMRGEHEGKDAPPARAAPTATESELTPRHIDVLQKLAELGNTALAAKELGIELSTVYGHTKEINGLLGTHHWRQAVLKALQLGIISVKVSS